MAACKMFVRGSTKAGKVMFFSVFIRRSTSVVFTSIITSYSYTLVCTAQKEGDVAASGFFCSIKKRANIPLRVEHHLFWAGSIDHQLEYQGCTCRHPRRLHHRPHRSCSRCMTKHTDPHTCIESLFHLGNKLNIKSVKKRKELGTVKIRL